MSFWYIFKLFLPIGLAATFHQHIQLWNPSRHMAFLLIWSILRYA